MGIKMVAQRAGKGEWSSATWSSDFFLLLGSLSTLARPFAFAFTHCFKYHQVQNKPENNDA